MVTTRFITTIITWSSGPKLEKHEINNFFKASNLAAVFGNKSNYRMELVENLLNGYRRFNLIKVGLDNDLFNYLSVPITSNDLAKLTGCDSRYIKEWCQG